MFAPVISAFRVISDWLVSAPGDPPDNVRRMMWRYHCNSLELFILAVGSSVAVDLLACFRLGYSFLPLLATVHLISGACLISALMHIRRLLDSGKPLEVTGFTASVLVWSILCGVSAAVVLASSDRPLQIVTLTVTVALTCYVPGRHAAIPRLAMVESAAVAIPVLFVGAVAADELWPAMLTLFPGFIFACYSILRHVYGLELAARLQELESRAEAQVDALTGLGNRRHFFARLGVEFNRARRQGTRLGVAVLDLDGFKPVNDLHGHATGDELLKQVGDRLRDACGEKIVIARLGGDEFTLIVPDVDQDAQLVKLGERICDALAAPYSLREGTVQISCTIGFAVYPDLADDAPGLYQRADYALYHCKRTSRGRALMFSAEHDAELLKAAEIEQALRHPNLESQFEVHFQPIIDLTTREPVAFEALARWNNPGLTPVSPAVFIPIAEKAGLVTHLTRLLLRKALHSALHWPEHIRLSFNLSARDISSTSEAMRVIAIIEESGFPPDRIDFEITETAMLHDFDQARVVAGMLSAYGCGISLDDFGTGFSSLSRLHALSLSKIKVDRSFVGNLHVAPVSYKIVKSLLSLSRDMDLECIVEGVESEEDLAVLLGLGCTLAQGYYFSRPLSPRQLNEYLSQTVPAPWRASVA